MQRTRRIARRVGTCVCVGALVGLGACSSNAPTTSSTRGRSSSTRRDTTTAPGGSTTAPGSASSTTIVVNPEASVVRAHMVDRIAGYELQPAAASGTGATDLAAAAGDAGGGAGGTASPERVALVDAGFIAGYKLLFANGANHQILAFAYRFATSSGARHYADHAFTTRVHDGGAPSTRTPPGVPGARAVERSEADASSALVLFTRGATLVILATTQPPKTDALGVLEPIALEQYAALAGY